MVNVPSAVAITKVVYNIYFTDINKTKVNTIEKQFLKHQITLNLICSLLMIKNNKMSMTKSVRCQYVASNNPT